MNEKLFIKYVSSFVLGDGGLSSLKSYARTDNNGNVRKSLNNKKMNSRYFFKQLSTHDDYFDFQRSILETRTDVRVDTLKAHKDKRGYNIKEILSLNTMVHPSYTKMRERIYFGGRKQIDPHYLKLWDEETLAFLYMDDGWIECTEQKSGNIYVRAAIGTHAYSYGDVLLLKNWMKSRFDVNFDIKRHKQKSGEYKFYLRNSKDNAKRFLDKIYKHSFPSFEYKFSFERFAPYKGVMK